MEGEYQLRDRIYVLNSQVDELKLLVDYQTSTITKLKQESLDKSRKILELEQISQFKGQVTTHTDAVFTPQLILSSVVTSNKHGANSQQFSAKTVDSEDQLTSRLDAFKVAERKILSLEDEKEFWRRHFEQADAQLKKVQKQMEDEKLLRFEDCRNRNLNTENAAQQLSNNNEATYVKNLLEENYQLKEKLDKIEKSRVISKTISKEYNNNKDINNIDKENIENGQNSARIATPASPEKKKGKPLGNRNVLQRNQSTETNRNTASQYKRNSSLENNRNISTETNKNVASEKSRNTSPERVRNKGAERRRNISSESQRNKSSDRNVEIENLSHQNKTLSSQVSQLQSELVQKAKELRGCTCTSDSSSKSTSQSKSNLTDKTSSKTKSFITSKTVSSKSSTTGYAKPKSTVSTGSQSTKPKNAQETRTASQNKAARGAQMPRRVCAQCSKLTCINEDGVDFEEEMEPDTVHLCEHIRCLQRQVCHLQYHIQVQDHHLAELRQVRCHLSQCQSENEALKCTCSQLSAKNQICATENQALKNKLDTVMSSELDKDEKVKKLISDIETQRDRYKTHVEKLLKDLQSKDPDIDKDSTKDDEKRGETNSCLKQKRVNFTGVDLLHLEEDSYGENSCQEESSSAKTSSNQESENIQLREQISRLQNELHQSTMEVHKLRRELMDTLTHKTPQYNDSPSKPVINCANAAEKDNMAAAMQNAQEKERLAKEREILQLQKSQLEAERAKLIQQQQQLHRSKSTSCLPDEPQKGSEKPPIQGSSLDSAQKAPETHAQCRTDTQNLKKRLFYLEKQLENTENALRTNQNLVTENSERNFEQSTQILKLKQSLNQANIIGDDLRKKLEKKDDVIRRVSDEKNMVIADLQCQKQKYSHLQIEAAECRERLARSQVKLDHTHNLTSQQAQDLTQREQRLEERLQELRQRETDTRQIDLSEENRMMREERCELSQQLEAMRCDNQELLSKIEDMNAEMKAYIDKVQHLETLIGDKEADRRSLLAQYEQLSRDLHQCETINRNLEMEADNTNLEVKSREAELEAARAKCFQSDEYIENMMRQNENMKTQIISLNAKVEMLTADLQENRIARDSVLEDLSGVNMLAVKLNTDKIELLHKIGEQNNEVEKLQVELTSLREELMSALSSVEDEKHRSKTLEKLVTQSSSEIRETVIKQHVRSSQEESDSKS